MSFILNSGRFGAAADPGLTLLQSATLWLDASDDIANAQWIRNKGTGGRALDAREGSVGSAQIVKGVLKLPGTTGNSASAPDAAALDITGDIEMVFRCAPTSWTVTQTLGGKWNSPSQKSYILYTEASTGKLWFWLSTDGTTGAGVLSSTAVGFSAGQAGWVKVTYRTSDRRVQFFTAADQTAEPSSWTQLGTDVTHSLSSIFSGTGSMWVGADTGTTNLFAGSFFRAIVRNGIGGTTVFDADFTAVSDLATSFTESSSNAATVTINSTTGVDTNDPLLLGHTGTNYLYLPGIAGNYASRPDGASLTATSSLEVVTRASAPSWSSAVTLMAHRSTGNTGGFAVSVSGTAMTMIVTNGGTATDVSYAATAAPTLVAGTTYWFKAVANLSTVEFFYAPDQSAEPSSWTQVGTTVTATHGSYRNAAVALAVGSNSSGNNGVASSFYRSILRVDGVAVFDADFTANTNQSSFTESSSNAATVTINRATSGRKSVMVTRPVWLFGTDDYMEVADNDLLDFAAGESFTLVAVHRQWNTPTSFGQRMSKNSAGGTTAGWSMLGDGTSTNLNASTADGTTQVYNTANKVAFTNGSMFVGAVVRDVVADTVTTFNNSTAGTPLSDTTTATLVNASPMMIGKQNGGSPYYADLEIVAVAVFRSALTSTQLGQIATYYGV